MPTSNKGQAMYTASWQLKGQPEVSDDAVQGVESGILSQEQQGAAR